MSNNDSMTAKVQTELTNASINFDKDNVRKIITEILAKTDTAAQNSQTAILSEVQSLNEIIHKMHSDLSDLSPQNNDRVDISSATDELDAVVAATEHASGKIMDAADKIQSISDTVGGTEQNEIMNCTMEIFEACSFQDITGQRIGKVVRTLREIESKVNSILTLFGPIPKAASQASTDTGETEGQKLANGPQLPSQAISQDEIDKLLADFG